MMDTYEHGYRAAVTRQPPVSESQPYVRGYADGVIALAKLETMFPKPKEKTE